MRQVYFPSGTVIDGRLKECPAHDEVYFSYEPPTNKQDAEYDQRSKQATSEVEATKLLFDVLARHLRKWTATKPGGEPIDFKNGDELNRMHPDVLIKIYKAIRHRTEGDGLLDAAGSAEHEDAGLKNS